MNDSSQNDQDTTSVDERLPMLAAAPYTSRDVFSSQIDRGFETIR